MTAGRCWYFAYGSNMHPATFRERRGIVAARAIPARLLGWQLVFDKPPLLPTGEAMANIVERSAAEVFGVAYEVGTDDLAHIDLTEGVLIGNYRRVAVQVQSIVASEVLDAFTLTSERRDSALRPSRRYMSLLIEGALAHGLPTAYVDWLRAIPAIDETAAGRMARAFIDRALKREPR